MPTRCRNCTAGVIFGQLPYALLLGVLFTSATAIEVDASVGAPPASDEVVAPRLSQKHKHAHQQHHGSTVQPHNSGRRLEVGQMHGGRDSVGSIGNINTASAYEEEEEQEMHHPASRSHRIKVQAGSLPHVGVTASEPSAEPYVRVPTLTVFIYTVLMAAASGLGAVPFLFVRRLSDSYAGLANAVACGVMLSASFDLLHEGAPYSPALTITGMALGAFFVMVSQQYLGEHEGSSFEDLKGADARKAMLIIGVMAAHAFGEGSGVGVSFAGRRGWAQGTLVRWGKLAGVATVTIAIGLHNIPEGMAVATVMVSRGAPPSRALMWTLLCSMPQAIVAVPSYLFVETFQALLPLALGFAAGCMVWIVFAELIPDALEAADHSAVATAATFSAAWLQCLSMLIATLEQPSGALASPIRADVSALVPRLLKLVVPGLLAACGAAAAAAQAMPSGPATLGAAAGVLGWMGFGSVATLLLPAARAQQGAAATLASAAVGAGGTALLWWMALGGKAALAPGEVKRSLAAELDDAAEAGLTAKQLQAKLLQQDAGEGAVQGVPAGGFLVSPRSSINAGKGLGDEQPTALRGLATTYPHALDGAASAEWRHEGSLQQHGGLAGHRLGSYPNSAAHANGHANGGTAVPLHPLAAPPAADEAPAEWSVKSSLLARASGGSSHKHCMLAAWFGAAGLLLRCGLAGGSLAQVLLLEWESLSHVAVPLMLQGLPIGLAALGLARAILCVTGCLPAVILAASGVLVMFGSAGTLLALSPVGVVASEDIAIDAGGLMEVGVALSSGALVLIAVLYIWPAAAAQARARRRAQAGLALGITAAVFIGALQSLLCLGTPYCLAVAVAQHDVSHP